MVLRLDELKRGVDFLLMIFIFISGVPSTIPDHQKKIMVIYYVRTNLENLETPN